MTQDIIDGALVTKSAVSYNGNEVNVQEIEDDDTEAIRAQQKRDIHEALAEL